MIKTQKENRIFSQQWFWLNVVKTIFVLFFSFRKRNEGELSNNFKYWLWINKKN